MKLLKKIYDVFMNIERYCLFGIFFFATIMVFVNVLGRKLFGFSFNWLEELNRYILVICTFVGASVAITMGNHPSMDSVKSLFKGRAKLIMEAVANGILMVFLASMAFYAFKQFGSMYRLGASTATLKLPVYVFFFFIPAGFTGMTIRSVFKFVLDIREAKNWTKESEVKSSGEEE